MSTEPESVTPLTPAEVAEEVTPQPPTTLAGWPVVSLSRLAASAAGGPPYRVGVKAVQAALLRLRFLAESDAKSGTFDSGTMHGYRALQLHLGFTSGAADGMPDKHSLTWLALRTGLYRMETD